MPDKISSILLVDDDETTNFLNQGLLQRMAVAEQVLVAENGQQALTLLPQLCPAVIAPDCPRSLILLDLNMPVMNGFDFLEAYQLLPPGKRPNSRIVVLTTSLLQRERERAQQLPVADILSKPLTREKVAALLEQYFPEG